ncbi:UNVERIFIED_CONTAM: hypothetical protein PYX00_005076 [Menopon gallinae]|uniref:Uncharacterized protein n=1 Tax=Menopon gallinae TaxID=328185 RepID=A0AAW2HPY6_9NEOP
MNEQCTMKVAQSTCSGGKCICLDGYLKFRSHTCLSAAKPGDVCFNNEHCKLWSKSSFCQFLIPNLIGRCVCNSQTGLVGSSCFAKEDIVLNREQENQWTTERLSATKFSRNNITLNDTTEKGNSSVEEEDVGFNEYIEKVKKPLDSDPSASDPFYDQRKHHHGKNESKYSVPDTTPVVIESPDGISVTVRVDSGLETSVTDAGYNAPKPKESSEGNAGAGKDRHEGQLNAVVNFIKTALNNFFSVKIQKTVGDVPAQLKYLENKGKISVGLTCLYDRQCQAADSEARCLNNVCECIIKDNKTDVCKGCPPETFQCRDSGVCLSWFFVCDGRKDCSDGSDEECNGLVCPKHAFQCGVKGICVSRSAICDGTRNCPNGEDELFCKDHGQCPQNSFQCKNGQCVPEYEFCNSRPACSDKSDELVELCGSKITEKSSIVLDEGMCPFRCKNGRCRSTAIMCSGRDGCGDNSDELHCTTRAQAPSKTEHLVRAVLVRE